MNTMRAESASSSATRTKSQIIPTSSTKSAWKTIARFLRTIYLLTATVYTLWHLVTARTIWPWSTDLRLHSQAGVDQSVSSAAAVSDASHGNAGGEGSVMEEPAVLSWAEWGQLHGVEWNKDVIEWRVPSADPTKDIGIAAKDGALDDDGSSIQTTEDFFLSKAFGDSLQPSKVIPYYYRATNEIKKKDITITTLVTSDRFKVLAALVQKYRGPISVTIHVSNNAPTRTELLESLHELYISSPYMSAYVDVHLVIDSFDRQFNMWRNVARYFARTDYIMMLDVDFAICTDFRQRILHSPQVLEKLEAGHSAFVVPAFEYVKQSDGRDTTQFPDTKKQLLELVQDGKIGMFHPGWVPGHGSTNYTRYYEAQPGEVYKVNQYTYAYEPYVIYKKEGTPYCDERFIGYGANKAACLFELYLSGVSFYVLPDDFLVHQSHEYAEAARKNERKYNRKLYLDFREELCFRYLTTFISNGKLKSLVSKNLLTECKKIKGFSGAADYFNKMATHKLDQDRPCPNIPDNVMDMFSLKGKYCVVAGAGSGIGLAAVEAFLEASASGVAMLYNSNDKTQDLAKELEKKHSGSRVIALKCPVDDPKVVAEVTQKVVDEFGRIDVYVANAGMGASGPITEMTDDYYQKTTAVNFGGVFYGAREAGKVFKKQGSGSFIITASMSGHIVNVPNTQALYNAHKAGVTHLGKSLAFEWKDFARVNIISPGFVETNMGAFNEILEINRNMTVMGRQGQTKEFKGIFLYFASNASTYTTGADILVDGGYTLP